jgi:hypothetical protein
MQSGEQRRAWEGRRGCLYAEAQIDVGVAGVESGSGGTGEESGSFSSFASTTDQDGTITTIVADDGEYGNGGKCAFVFGALGQPAQNMQRCMVYDG